jgi:hypothetical protein
MSAQSDTPTVSPVKSSRLFQSMKGSFSAASTSGVGQNDVPTQTAPVVTTTPIAPTVPDTLPLTDSVEAELELELPDHPDELIDDQKLTEEVPQEAQEELGVDEVVLDVPVEEESSVAAEETTEDVTQVLHQHVDTLNPPNAIGGGSAKEAPMLNISVERPAVDVVPGMQQVEVEHAHEMPPEVEGFLKTVEDHHDQVPQEIVISNPQTGQALPRVMAQPVIVLPLTPQMEEEGKKKPANFSVRWLIEWSWKIMKQFSGKVVYRKM